MKLRFCISLMVFAAAMSGASADESLEAGKDMFRSECIACHAFECNKSGPRLAGLIGRKAGSVADFSGYIDELRNSGIVWSEDTLNAFLTNPSSVVTGTLMALAGRIEGDRARGDLIAFLKSGDTSLDLCF
ncbi:MAG: cytochrome c family protein [Gammaproteobacteria bacterium]|nr:cytochrome c family protein [Gammaproteobacteria bacterium]